MRQTNCWEFLECGREPGGKKVHELGVCPAAAAPDYDGINSGYNGGRVCWAIAGTFCQGIVQGRLARKIASCLDCTFLKKVMQEEGPSFQLIPPHTTQP